MADKQLNFAKDGLARFSNEGFRIRRNNPDGTIPSPSRTLGFLGTDNSDYLYQEPTATSVLSYRIGGKGDFTDLTVDITGVATWNVDALVTKLNAAATFSALFTASKDVETKRLCIALTDASTVKYLELTGVVALALGIGGGDGVYRAMGTAFVDVFDDCGAISFDPDITDSENIEQESSRGDIDRMVIAPKLNGLTFTLAINTDKTAIKAMLVGGNWEYDEATEYGVYTPPARAMKKQPVCSLEAYVAMYGRGDSQRADMKGYKCTKVNTCTGKQGSIPAEVKSWSSDSFDCTCGQYTDESGNISAGYLEETITISEGIVRGIA